VDPRDAYRRDRHGEAVDVRMMHDVEPYDGWVGEADGEAEVGRGVAGSGSEEPGPRRDGQDGDGHEEEVGWTGVSASRHERVAGSEFRPA
jgi:hypothetical protein